MRFGILLNRLNHGAFIDAAQAADELGYESIWLGEHLVLPIRQDGEIPSTYPPIPATLPILDPMMCLASLAARTERIMLGTFVYLLNIRHPFVGARAAVTLDRLSGGRFIFGVGAGWLRSEYQAAGIDPATRAARLDEAVTVCRRLWQEDVVAHNGLYYPFESVAFEPKPLRKDIPIHFGGESERAFRRVGTSGDGWLGVHHSPVSAEQAIGQIMKAADDAGRNVANIEMTIVADPSSEDEVRAYRRAGVDRLIVSPWRRTPDALPSMAAFAERFMTSSKERSVP
jgi:probable F420-dependent oxidoreductase